MENERIYSKERRKFPKLSLKDKIQEKLNNSINSLLSVKEKKNFHNKNSSFYKMDSPRRSRGSMMFFPAKRNTASNPNINFKPFFGNHVKRNSNQMNKSINMINNSINNSVFSSENSEQEKNLKIVENEIKNKLKDMTVIMTNKSFIMENRWKEKLDISSVEEKPKHKKKKKKMEVDENKDRKIIKKKVIFDSLDEDENIWDDDDYIFINPETRFIFVLDTIIFTSTFICFIYNPIQIAMSKCFCINEHIFMKIIMCFIDLIFIFDFFVSFNRAFYNYEYKLIKNPKLILKKYLTGNFFFDFLQSLPFNIIITYLCQNRDKYKPDGPFCLYNGINGIYISIKLCSLIKIMKVLKILNKKKNKAYEWLQEIDNSFYERLIRVFFFTFLILSCTNLFICLHIFIGEQSDPNWMVSMGIQDSSFFEIYIAALYGIIETLTTVGYGDVTCDSFTEICFQIILLSVGIVAYSWLITTVGNYVKNESKAEIKHSKDLTLLEEIRLEFPELSFKLYNKIHQHLKSVSNQQKKVDLNILVNSLPYSVKNLVLFKVYDKCIHKFNFFKKCENTDFISRVLTNFIPLFSKEKALLIREGENIENIFFVNSGVLTIDVALDIKAPVESIKRYIYEKFDDIIEKDKENNRNEKTNKSITRENISQQFERINTGFQNIFNQRNSLAGQSYHESHIEQEIGKCDLGGSEEDIEERNNKFLHIMHIKRNEHFGITYMFLNKPSPLSLRVKSKKADIFLLRKHDATLISKAYPRIWKVISEKAFHNMLAIKNKTFETLRSYCSCYGLTLDNNYEPTKTRKLDPLNMFEIKELMQLEKVKKEEEKIQKSKNKTLVKNKTSKFKKKFPGTVVFKEKDMITKIKNNLFKKYSQNHLLYNGYTLESPKHELIKMKSLQPAILTGTIPKMNYKEMKLSKIIEDDSEKDLHQFKIYEPTEIISKEQDNTLKDNINDIKNEDLKLTKQNEEKNEIEEDYQEEKEESNEKEEYYISNSNSNSSGLEKTNKIYSSENDKSYPNTLSNLPPNFASFIKKRVIKKKIKNKNFYKLMCLKLIETFNNYIKSSSNNIKIDIENINNNITSINNYNNSNIKDTINNNSNLNYLISDEVNRNLDLISSFTKQEKSGIFEIDKLFISKNDSFELKSIYNNLNVISSGKYGKNKMMQKDTEEFVLYYNQKDMNTSKFLNLKNNSRLSLLKVKKDGNLENSFSMLIGNLSEIKSHNSIIEQDQLNPIKQFKTSKNVINTPASKSKKTLGNAKKNKKYRNSSQKDVKNKNFLELDNIYLNNAPSSVSQNNISENSENKIIKSHKSKMARNNDKKINYGDKKTKTFIKKVFTKKKTKKENINKSQSKEYLNEFNILNQENVLRDSRNIEELKNRTLDKLKMINERKENKDKSEDNKNSSSKEVDNNNCMIY
mgnify:CR=1 FL=1